MLKNICTTCGKYPICKTIICTICENYPIWQAMLYFLSNLVKLFIFRKAPELKGNMHLSSPCRRNIKDNPDNIPDALLAWLQALERIGVNNVDCFYKYGVLPCLAAAKQEVGMPLEKK